MTDPLSPEEIEVKPWSAAMIAWLRRSTPGDLEPSTMAQLADIAEDHARLVAEVAVLRKEREYRFADLEALRAENAKLRERVEKLERTCASGSRAIALATTAVHSPDQQDLARWCAARDVFCAHFAALAATEEEPR